MPLISSYCPTEPNERPAKVGEVVCEMTIFVTRASTEQTAASENATAKKGGSALWNFAGRNIETSSLIFVRYVWYSYHRACLRDIRTGDRNTYRLTIAEFHLRF